MDALQKRQAAIQEKLGSNNPQQKLISNMWLIILLIGVFSIAAIAAVKLFDDSLQLEWVASGQVIQFVTVMILLSVNGMALAIIHQKYLIANAICTPGLGRRGGGAAWHARVTEITTPLAAMAS